MDNIDSFDDHEIAGGVMPAGPSIEALRPLMWGSLCLELVLEPDRAEEICKDYGSSAQEVINLLGANPAFKEAMREAKQRVDSLGPNAGFVLRSQAMAERYLPELDAIVRDRSVSAVTRLKAIENAVRYGRLDPAVERQGKDAAGGAAGVSVHFNFGNALSHLLGAAGSALTVDAQPTRPEV